MTVAEDRDQRKLEAAERALALVTPGMKLGLGSGSTAHHFVDLVGERVKAGLDIHCVATSEATAAQAKALRIPVVTLDELPELDLTVDGADEIDSNLRLIKGGGGALLREKIVASASKRMVVIADFDQARGAARRVSIADRGRSIWPCGDPAPYRARLREARAGWADASARRNLAFHHRRRPLYS